MRISELSLKNSMVELPAFMPVGTKGTLKGLLQSELEQIGYKLSLSNTFHLYNKPGNNKLIEYNGIKNMNKLNQNLLTDSGGFQMVSLSKLTEINEDHVKFANPYQEPDPNADPNTTPNNQIILTPEDSVQTQINIGTDIIMQLDDVIPAYEVAKDNFRERVQLAADRSIRWLDRSMEYINKIQGDQVTSNIFPIVQGGVDLELRKQMCAEICLRNVPGVAIGGLVGGESKHDFVKVVSVCCDNLPADIPRQVMGVGQPEDIVLCILLGADMFDCVWPARTARFGQVITSRGLVNVKTSANRNQKGVIEEGCPCTACTEQTLGQLSCYMDKNELVSNLLTEHNQTYIQEMIRQMKNAALEGKLNQWVIKFYEDQYKGKENVPEWIVDGLKLADIEYVN